MRRFLTLVLGLRPRRRLILCTVSGVISGIAGTALVACIHKAVTRGGSLSTEIWLFTVLCCVQLASGIAARSLMVRVAQGAMVEFRMNLSRNILRRSLSELERTGAHRLQAALTVDVNQIGQATELVPILCVNVVALLGCVAYVAYLSVHAFLCLSAFIVGGVVTYRIVQARMLGCYRLAREQQDSLFGHIRALTHGIKELLLSQRRRDAFMARVLKPTADSFAAHSVAGGTLAAVAGVWGQLLFLVCCGVLLLSPLSGSVVERSGYVIAVLYLLAPMEAILSILPMLSRADVALAKIEALGLHVSGEAEPSEAAAAPPVWAPVDRIELRGVKHTFHDGDGGDKFTLGPVDLTLAAGEVVFLIGGNGSGKTTLAKLVVGLYEPVDGEVRAGHRVVTPDCAGCYKQCFAAVFSDAWVFDRVLEYGPSRLVDESANAWLAGLGLAQKCVVKDGAISGVEELSQGQRKRLALFAALLEDRPFYLLDEWAAEQEPAFKDVFYRQIIPELRRRGKGVVVITHDDRYFHLSDRVIKLSEGRLAGEGDEIVLTRQRARTNGSCPEMTGRRDPMSQAAEPGSICAATEE